VQTNTPVKLAASLGGILLVVVGLLGSSSPRLLGLHLSPALNILHFVSGAVALYFGLRSTPVAAARRFCLIFGALCATLGLASFLAAGPLHERLPGAPASGIMDHVFHLVLGAAFLAAGSVQQKVAAPLRPD